MSHPDPTPPTPPPRPRPWRPLVAIAAIAALLAAAFAWSAGWLGGPQRLTAQRMTDAIEAGGPPHPGFRRAHSKGMCVSGHFEGNGQARALSSARVFTQAAVPVLGRMSIGGGDPHGADATARVRSMALLLRSDDGQQWRTAMNSFPFFVVATPEGFMAQTLAAQPDPATGKPDPAKLAAFAQRYPEAKKFQEWAKTAPWSDSWANTQYNGVNSFRFIGADGSSRFVRWSMRPQTAFKELSAAQRAQADADFLGEDLQARLAQGPLRWDLVLTVAAPGDPVNDPSQPWPQDRQQVVAGTLVLDHAEPQATGPCRDLNYDPLILPRGIAGSGDPILAARSAVYAHSFNRREREIGRGQAPEATGQAHAGAQ
ncbi:catalase family peroxidase [Xanthomonas translucens]|uniref:catalase family peroxidase n=1 Tax=Xanthomonas campestris pv. translucens TaxID=343 RepID=UPI0006419E95|nr:catalase family peroxidase [Xanthomonas translucens]AKK69308.1 catalase [Xanthomonas translucens pv. undulosa]AVY68275.1 catalase [Xanthomonas translucens pv. undulosa]MBC3972898.1 catalase family peroxidase [Xanthomonas translucens pv. undulosa]MCT8272184.1 catalase family peroxidase [Xanthomonas translucens pv. undulosa]WLA04613.1 catalase family peroxidase [Xanthomonas translucens]